RDKVSAAAPVLLTRMADFPKNRRYLLEEARALDPGSTVAPSRQLLHDEDRDVRFLAAQILLRQGGTDTDRAIEAIRGLDREQPGRSWPGGAFDDLMDTGRPEAIELAARSF